MVIIFAITTASSQGAPLDTRAGGQVYWRASTQAEDITRAANLVRNTFRDVSWPYLTFGIFEGFLLKTSLLLLEMGYLSAKISSDVKDLCRKNIGQ